ncbi:MAG: hypothetical protein AAF495_06935 [Pseudomonadota bacterium]
MTGGGYEFTMVGVGIFYILFWIGFVVGYGLGLHILTMLGIGLISGYAGLVVLNGLERLGPRE